jgi:hypothetical protein
MVFIGTEHIEELKPHNVVQKALFFDPQIKKLLGIPIHIQGLQSVYVVMIIGKTLFSVAISGRAAGIDKPDIIGPAVAGQIPGIMKVIGKQIIRVFFSSRGTGPHVNDGFNPGKAAPDKCG